MSNPVNNDAPPASDANLLIGFILGCRVTQAANRVPQTQESHAKGIALLQKVADGSKTIDRTPAELRHCYPKFDREKLEEVHKKSVSQSRVQAQAVLRAMQKTLERNEDSL